MTGQARAHHAGRWLERAWADLIAARAALADPEHFEPYLVCFLSQQGAEKALKAALIYAGIPLKHVHDLDALARMLPPNGWRAYALAGRLGDLTQHATEARYPDAEIDPTPEEAANAVELAASIYGVVLDDLTANGLTLPESGPQPGPA